MTSQPNSSVPSHSAPDEKALPAAATAKISAEFIGTFAMVFAGCGAIIVNETSNGALGHIGICATFGLVIMVMIYATGHISGAHFNPAVTLGFFKLNVNVELGPAVDARCGHHHYAEGGCRGGPYGQCRAIA